MAATAPPLLTGALAREAAGDALRKLDPRQLVRNPVMAVTALAALLATLLWVLNLARGTGSPAFEGQIVGWLWATVLFANFAEAVAEGRGKAQAGSLRAARAELTAKRSIGVAGAWEIVPASALKVGEEVIVEPGDLIPADGEVISGVGSVNEAAITGESAPVIWRRP
jgi:K+-transporting ATPase ATPase B chain